jgi:plasmid stabilization system protein ParE
VTVLLADGVEEIFGELPESVKLQAARSIDLLSSFPRMYPVRRRGLMRGYRYFVADRHLFYYSVTSSEVRLAAIIPAAMRRA